VNRAARAAAIAALAAVIALPPMGATAITVSSPDRAIIVRVETAGPLRYGVSFHGRPAILESRLGLVLRDGTPIGERLALDRVTRRAINSVWENRLGKRRRVVDRANELTLALREPGAAGRRIELVVRAYDDGCAFRYTIPRQPATDRFVLEREETHFRFAGDPTVWAPDYGGFASPQESEFKCRHVSELAAERPYGTPMLVQAGESCYVGITEAELKDWAGMYLGRSGGVPGEPGSAQPPAAGTQSSSFVDADLVTRLAPRRDGRGLVSAEAPHLTPWRVLLIGRRPGDLVESDLVLNLSAPNAIGDASWVKPGMCAWDHWWSGDVKMDTATEKEYVAFASEMNFPYQLVDWQWYGPFNTATADITRANPSLDMPELLRFAAERHVRLFVWLHSNDVDRFLKAGRLEEAFALYSRWGLAGVKIDFMDHDDQEMVNWYYTVTAMAASHHLMVDFHGAFKPTGMQRAYPNQITREGVLGEEYDKFSSRVTPEHDCTLPFTRMLAGPMDYTPGGFLDRSRGKWRQTLPTEVQGTRCHELAKFVVFDSPLTVVCDSPEHYRGQPGVEFLRSFPTVWDDSRLLEGFPGEFVVSARRTGTAWYIGGMTNWAERTVVVPLAFLGSGHYSATLYADSPDSASEAEHLTESRRIVTAKDSLAIRMAPGGGFAIRLVKQ